MLIKKPEMIYLILEWPCYPTAQAPAPGGTSRLFSADRNTGWNNLLHCHPASSFLLIWWQIVASNNTRLAAIPSIIVAVKTKNLSYWVLWVCISALLQFFMSENIFLHLWNFPNLLKYHKKYNSNLEYGVIEEKKEIRIINAQCG